MYTGARLHGHMLENLVQVALTDLEDVVDGGGQTLACGGYG